MGIRRWFENQLMNLRKRRAEWLDRHIVKRKFKDVSMSLISNNCWASMSFYQRFDIQYNIPTVGLFISDTDFMKFCENISYYLQQPLNFIRPEQSPAFKEVYVWGEKSGNVLNYDFPVAMIDDVTLWFMHYHSEEEAREKWTRRCKRVNLKNLMIKWSQRYTDDTEIVNRFLALPLPRKFAFVDENCKVISPELVKVPGWINLRDSGGDEIALTNKLFNTIDLINSYL